MYNNYYKKVYIETTKIFYHDTHIINFLFRAWYKYAKYKPKQ